MGNNREPCFGEVIINNRYSYDLPLIRASDIQLKDDKRNLDNAIVQVYGYSNDNNQTDNRLFNTANGNYCLVWGKDTVSDMYEIEDENKTIQEVGVEYEFVVGRYNEARVWSVAEVKEKGLPLFVVGNGTGPEDHNRSNAFVVTDKGALVVQKLYVEDEIQTKTSLRIEDKIIYTNNSAVPFEENDSLSGLVIKTAKTNDTDTGYGILFDGTDANNSVKLGYGQTDKNGVFQFSGGIAHPVATRADSNEWTSDAFARWDANNYRFVAGSIKTNPNYAGSLISFGNSEEYKTTEYSTTNANSIINRVHKINDTLTATPNTVEGIGSVALGYGNYIKGDTSAILGRNNIVYGASHGVFGVRNIIVNPTTDNIIDSFVSGYGNTITNSYIMCGGYQNTVTGLTAAACGSGNTANGANSISFGQGTTANGNRSLSAGLDTYANGANSISFGQSTTAWGENSLSYGQGWINTTDRSQGTGIAYGDRSLCGGMQSQALHENSVAIGYRVRTSRINQVVIGQNNINDSNMLFVVGNGSYNTGNEVRSNAFMVHSNGTARIGAAPINDMDVANKGYVDGVANSFLWQNGSKDNSIIFRFTDRGGNIVETEAAESAFALGGDRTPIFPLMVVGVQKQDGTINPANQKVTINVIGNTDMPQTNKDYTLAFAKDYIYSGLTTTGTKDISFGATGEKDIAVFDGITISSGIKSYTVGASGTETDWDKIISIDDLTVADLNTFNISVGDTIWTMVGEERKRRTSKALGFGSVAMVPAAAALGQFSVVIAKSGTATGTNAYVLGAYGRASGFTAAAIGYNNWAEGDYSLAANGETKALGAHSAAFGERSVSLGTADFTVGFANNTSVASNISTTANLMSGYNNNFNGDAIANIVGGNRILISGNQNIIGGYKYTYSGNYSLVAGSEHTTINANNVVVGGIKHSVSGNYSAVFGRNNTVNGLLNLLGGEHNTIVSNDSLVGGSHHIIHTGSDFVLVAGSSNTIVSGGSLFVAGYSNTANRNYLGIIGVHNTSSGESSFTFGKENTNINAAYALVGGQSNTITNTWYSIVQGQNNTVSGASTVFIIGANNTSDGKYNTVLLGEGLTAGKSRQLIVGRNNMVDSNALFIIADGADSANPKNVFTVNSKGIATAGADPVDNLDLTTKQYVDAKYLEVTGLDQYVKTVDLPKYYHHTATLRIKVVSNNTDFASRTCDLIYKWIDKNSTFELANESDLFSGRYHKSITNEMTNTYLATLDGSSALQIVPISTVPYNNDDIKPNIDNMKLVAGIKYIELSEHVYDGDVQQDANYLQNVVGISYDYEIVDGSLQYKPGYGYLHGGTYQSQSISLTTTVQFSSVTNTQL